MEQCHQQLLIKIGFKPCPNEPILYYHPKGTILALWIDDIFITGPDTDHIAHALNELKKEFQVKVLGNISYALGIHFQPQDDGSYFLSQKRYIDNIVDRFGLSHSRSTATPLPNRCNMTQQDCPVSDDKKEYMANVPYRSALGKLLYLAMATRPDILFL